MSSFVSNSLLCCSKKIRKHKNMEPWAVSNKNPKIRKVECGKIKWCHRISREIPDSLARRRIPARAKVYSLARRRIWPARRYTVSREDVFSVARSSNSLAWDHTEPARRKEIPAAISRAEQSSRAARRESSREDSEARAKLKDLARKPAPGRTDCTDNDEKIKTKMQ